MKKKILIILLCTILFVLIGASLYLKRLVNDVNSIMVSNLNMANITDGIYVGKYSITPVYVEVEVTVTEHKITNIKIIEHENGLGGKAEKIVDDVISRKSLWKKELLFISQNMGQQKNMPSGFKQ